MHTLKLQFDSHFNNIIHDQQVLSFHTDIDFNLAVTSPVEEGSPSEVTLTPRTALPRQVVITVTLQTDSAQGMNLPLSIDTTDQN